jgi:hypothetical protein
MAIRLARGMKRDDCVLVLTELPRGHRGTNGSDTAVRDPGGSCCAPRRPSCGGEAALTVQDERRQCERVQQPTGARRIEAPCRITREAHDE